MPTLADARKVAIKMEKLPGLAPVGGSMTVLVGEEPVLLVRTTDDEVRAFSATCTHEQCDLGYDSRASVIRCTCHKSHFDLDGRNVAGPAPSPVRRYRSLLVKRQLLLLEID